MFKKAIIVVGLCAALPFTVNASDGSGCGLGKLILEGKSGKGANIGAAILNNAIFPQTSAMTSGTMGCDTTTLVKNEQQKRDVFVASNIDNLSVDVAQGKGDYLSSLAQIMKIEDEDKGVFYTLAQLHYEEMFVSSLQTNETLAVLDNAMASNTSLAKYIN